MNGKIVFFGTSSVCLPYLELLNKHFNLSLIVTQPDRRGGRNRKASIIHPVKAFALENKIEVIQPQRLRCNDVIEKIKEINPLISVVISYGRLIPSSVFTLPKFNSINVHYSLLPFYRGAAPVQRAIENGDKVSGISIFELAKSMDSGDIWASKEIEIKGNDTTQTVWQRMSALGANFLLECLEGIFEGKIDKKKQNHEKATFAPAIKKEEGIINWQLSSDEIINKLRAFTPWPGICFNCENKKIKIIKAKSLPDIKGREGDVLNIDKEGLLVACNDGAVLIEEFQPECKKAMKPADYVRGNKLPSRLL